MHRFRACLSLAIVGLSPGLANAQEPGLAVQLPTFSHFSVGTTVSVPDRGSAYMGGINRSASGRSSFGSPLLPLRPFRNTAIGSEQSAMGVHVRAWIHDFAAMDEYLLNQAPRTVQPGAGRFGAISGSRGPASLDPAWNAGNIGSTWNAASRDRADAASGGQWQSQPQPPPATPLLDVAEEQRRRHALAETRSSEAEAFFLRGQEAEASGKANVARIYYQMAARRATGEFQNEVLARLRAVAQPDTAGALVRSRD